VVEPGRAFSLPTARVPSRGSGGWILAGGTSRVLGIWFALLAGVMHADSGLLPVWDVESPVFNALGGSYNTYSSDGCEIVLQRTPWVHRGPAGHSLKITYNNLNGVSCGIWMHLFKEGALSGASDFPDMTHFPYLSFWIKEGGKAQDMEIRMADSVWFSREDSKPAGRASKYLGQSGNGWREVVIPFRDFQLPSSKAAVVALQFAPQTSGVMYVDDICFKNTADLQPPYSRTLVSRPGVTRRRAMWLWETMRLLENSARQQEALATLREAHVTDLFLQVPRPTAENGSAQLELKPELRRFLRTAHATKIRVHALDGFPEFSLREHHEFVLSLVRNVIAFNLSSPPEERFDGVHLDNEPYQLLGFEGSIRDEILREYLELNEKVATLLHNEAPGLAFGADIPFWWDATGDHEHPCCLVTFNGRSDSVAHHVIDLLDNVGIMAYRNFAGGLDGIVNHAQGDVDYAGQRGKQAFVAVETFRQPPEYVLFAVAIAESQWQALPAQSSLLRLSQLQGYPLRTFTDGVHRYIGLADKKEARTPQASFAMAIGTLCLSLPGLSSDWILDLRGLQSSVERYGRTSDEWHRVSASPLEKWSFPGRVGLSVIQEMPAKITLAGGTREFVDEVLQEVGDAFGHDPGFTGDAIHSLESYQELRRK